MLQAFAQLICEGYVPERPALPESVKIETDECFDEEDEETKTKTLYLFTPKHTQRNAIPTPVKNTNPFETFWYVIGFHTVTHDLLCRLVNFYLEYHGISNKTDGTLTDEADAVYTSAVVVCAYHCC